MNEKSKYRFETARENDDFRGGDPKNLRTGAGGGRVLGAAKGEPSPSTPSGAVAPYLKAEAKKRKRKTGREVGHEGAHRVSPEPDEVVELGLECCPECGGPVSKCRGKSTLKHRIIEDIPEDTKVKTTQYDVPTFWCPNCKKAVSPKVPDALPNATIGNRLAILTAWLHYANGNSIGQILDIFNFHMAVKLTSGGLVGIWTRLAEILRPWYDEIREKCLQSAVLHGDESGWRVDGDAGSGVFRRAMRRTISSTKAAENRHFRSFSKSFTTAFWSRIFGVRTIQSQAAAGKNTSFICSANSKKSKNTAIRPTIGPRFRKNSNVSSATRFDFGATVVPTFRRRRLNPTAALAAALRQFVLSGKLPLLESVTSKE